MNIKDAREALTGAMLLAAATFVACTQNDDRPAAAVITMFDVKEQLLANKGKLEPVGLPFAGRFTNVAGNLGLDVLPAFAEGKHAAYFAPEYWLGFSKLWVQPMYVMVREVGGKLQDMAEVRPVFSVGPDSAFYSPYWRVFFVVVPLGDPAPEFRTTKAVLDSGYRLVPGPGRLCSLAPAGTDLTNQVRGNNPQAPPHPLLGTPIGAVGLAMGWVDGFDSLVDVVSVGDDRFTFNANGEVDEAPLYVFRVQAEGLSPARMGGLPTVGGRDLGPPSLGLAAPNNRPAFGSLWRLYWVDLPSTAGVITPKDPVPPMAARQSAIAAAGLTTAMVDLGVLGSDIYFRPVLDVEGCAAALRKSMDAAPTLPPSLELCQFLDSQGKVQAAVPPQKISRSEITANCPFVTYDGKAVPLSTATEPRP